MQVVFRSEEQQHDFNFPYQLGSQSRDRPSHADVKQYVVSAIVAFVIGPNTLHRVKVAEGDIVVLGTDGLFDNLFDEDIIQSIQSTLAEHKGANDIAHKMAQKIAQVASQVRNNFKLTFRSIFDTCALGC